LTRDLRPLFDPRSVAIVGASATPGKWGYWLAQGALQAEERRAVFLVNRNGGEILGRTAYRSLAELPESPELVVITVPADGFEEAVDGALDAGAKALVVISAGLGEGGPEGRERERVAVERIRDAGALLVGPNCLGLFDAETNLHLSSNSVPSGPIGLISQSGNLALEVGMLAGDAGLGFSRFVSLGNQADLEAAELIHDFREHEPTRVIAVYCEDFRDGRAFARAAQQAVEAGKPVLLIAGGGTPGSARAARSHTGALVSDLLERQLSEIATLEASEYSVERTAPVEEGIELIVGSRRDPRFGPVTLVGMGGLYTEVLGDVAVALAPIGEDEAERLICSLRGAPLLLGARGRPALDVPAAARATAAFSRAAGEHPEIDELEINPLLVLPEGALGLDARIVLGGVDRDAA